MFGYATTETPQLCRCRSGSRTGSAERLAEVRKSGLRRLPASGRQDPGHHRLRRRGAASTVETVVLSTQHSPAVATAQLRAEVERARDPPGAVRGRAGRQPIPACSSTRPADSRSAGRRATPASRAARSSSTPTAEPPATAAAPSAARTRRRSTAPAAYAMRWVAKNAVAAGLADRLEVQVAYAIGKAAPVGLYVESFGTGHVRDEAIIAAIREVFDLRPGARSSATSTCCGPIYAADRGLRPLRPRAARLHLGAPGPRRRPAQRRRPLAMADGIRSPGCSSTRRCLSSTGSSTTGFPTALVAAAQPGVRVRVPLRRPARVADGFIVELAWPMPGVRPARSASWSPWSRRCACSPPKSGRWPAAVADRAAGSANDMMRLAIPPPAGAGGEGVAGCGNARRRRRAAAAIPYPRRRLGAAIAAGRAVGRRRRYPACASSPAGCGSGTGR